MEPKRLTDKTSRVIARRKREGQWEFMERVAREGAVWMCPWDKYGKHENQPRSKAKIRTDAVNDGDGVYVFGLLGSNEFFHWLDSHKDWWKRGRWSEKRCARSIRITDAGRKALRVREQYDMEPIFGGMVEPGYVVTPWPKERGGASVRKDQMKTRKRAIKPCRDPRIDPKAGDVFLKGDERRKVSEIRGKAVLCWDGDGAACIGYSGYSAPWLFQFRKWAKNSEVIHAS